MQQKLIKGTVIVLSAFVGAGLLSSYRFLDKEYQKTHPNANNTNTTSNLVRH